MPLLEGAGLDFESLASRSASATIEASFAVRTAQATEEPVPKHFFLNLTHRCTFRCDMCTQYGGRFKQDHPPELAVEDWHRLIDEIAPSLPSVTLFGGEPLLYTGVRAVIRHLGETGCPTELVSNGFLLGECLDEAIDLGVTPVLSIDGLGAQHDRIRNCPGSFERLRRCLERLRDRGADFCVNCVVLPDNLESIDALLSFLSGYGPRWVTLQHLQFSSEDLNARTAAVWAKSLGITYATTLIPRRRYEFTDEYLRKLRDLVDRVRTYPHWMGRLSFLPNLEPEEVGPYYSEGQHDLRKRRTCSRPWRTPVIDPNGDVLVCLDHAVGNIRDASFSKIWQGEAAISFRRALREHGRFPICRRCCAYYSNPNYLWATTIARGAQRWRFPEGRQELEPSARGLVVLDFPRIHEDPDLATLPVVAVPVHSREEEHAIRKYNVVLGDFADL